MSNLTSFNFEARELRVVKLRGEPWFVAKDVCDALTMKGAASTYLYNLDDQEKQVLNRNSDDLTVNVRRGLFFNSHASRLTIISESGLYKLVLRSDKPQAKPFQDWVTKVVLPAIRKDGGYIAGEELE